MEQKFLQFPCIFTYYDLGILKCYNFEDWNKIAVIDGWVCRNEIDCLWIDDNLGCDARLLKNSEVKVVYNVSPPIALLFDQN